MQKGEKRKVKGPVFVNEHGMQVLHTCERLNWGYDSTICLLNTKKGNLRRIS